jgi:signal transduction histidine kinase/ligand-binding sensor domain-containing protein
MTAPYLVRFGLFALAAGLSSAGETKAQPPYALDHQSWTTEAGLPQNSVHQILQSHDGFLWIATEGGAVRYDGFSFKVFSHDTDPSFTTSDISSLAEDRQGNMWFGTADGAVEYTNGHTIHFGLLDGLPAASIGSIAATADGSVLALTSGGLARFDGRRFHVVKPQPASLNEIQPQQDGSVALVGKSGAFAYRHGSISELPLPTSLQGFDLRGVVQQSNGSMWLWTDREIQVKQPNRRWTWRVGLDLPGTRIQKVVLDRSGGAWVGTNRGLVTLTPGQHSYNVGELGANSILSVLPDAEGNLWIGTETSGLHILRRRTFREQPALAGEEVSCVAEASDHSIWIGTREDGLRRVRPGSVTSGVDRPVNNNALTSPVILSLAPGLRGDMWVGTPDGLTHVDPTGKATGYTSSDGLPDDFVRSLLVARDGTLWIGTRHGLAHFQSGNFALFTTTNGLGSDFIGPLYQADDGDIWVGTLSGISRIRAGTLKTYGTSDGFNRGPVTGLTQDQTGHLWVSTDGSGVLLWNGTRFQSVKAPGLANNLYGLIVDGQGFLWFRSLRSMSRIATLDLAKCVLQSNCRPRLTIYGAADGISTEEFLVDSRPSMWRSSSGELWVATRKGVAIVNPAFLSPNEVPPPLVIESFSSDNKEVPLTSGIQALPSARARYTFEYAALSYTIPSKVLYRTKLEGFDSEWSTPTTRRNASYTNLPPGSYTFHVQAANNDGVWNLTGAQLQFNILPPFYRRLWFFVALVATVGCLVLLVYRLRMRKLHLRFEAVLAERNRIAREIHDTLAQDLVGISVQLNLVSQLLDSRRFSDAIQQLTLTRTLVTEGLEEARRSIWDLRTNRPDGTLPSQLTALTQRYSTGDLTIDATIRGTYRRLPHTIENEVLRVVQEAITNIRRHAAATHAVVCCQYESDKLTVTIEDNGRGFTVIRNGSTKGTFGLKGMRERTVSVSGELNVISTPGAGTRVEVEIPIKDIKGRDT